MVNSRVTSEWRSGATRLGPNELHPPVQGAVTVGAIGDEWLMEAVPLGHEPVRRGAMGDEVSAHRVSARLGQMHVVSVCADVVGVALDLEADLRVVVQDTRDL